MDDALGTSPVNGLRIALFTNSFRAGGAEVSLLRIAEELTRRGCDVDLLLCEREGELLAQLSPLVRVIELDRTCELRARWQVLRADPTGLVELARPILLPKKPPHRLRSLAGLAAYLKDERPAALLAFLPTPSMLAVWAKRLARSSARIVVSHRNTFSSTRGDDPKWRKRYLPTALRRTYLMADAITAVSEGVAADLAREVDIPRERIRVIANPVVTPAMLEDADRPVQHPWFQAGEPPVVLGVGALIEQKDFPTLIRAFARLRAEMSCRLVICGDAKRQEDSQKAKTALRALAHEHGIDDDLDLPGFVEQPMRYMKKAAVFVLSSRFEGLPGVLIQALAVGCPVVATDCPHGPREILAGGRLGPLVPVGDDTELADAIARTLADPPERGELRRRGADYSVGPAVDAYLELLLPDEVR